MKKSFKRFVALLFAMLLAIMVPLTVFATTASNDNSQVEALTTTATNEEAGTNLAKPIAVNNASDTESKDLSPFIVIGSILIIGGSVILVTKKYMQDAEE